MNRMARKKTAPRGQGVASMALSDLCMIGCVDTDNSVKSMDGRETWQSVEDWHKERIRRHLAGTLIYNFPAPGKE